MNAWFQNSDLFKNVGESKFRPGLILTILIFFCLWGGSIVLGRFLVTPLIEILPRGTLWSAFALSLRRVLVCGIQIITFFAWVKFVEKRRIITMGLICKHKTRAYLGSVFLGFCAITTITLVLMLVGAIEVKVSNLLSIDFLIGSLLIAVFGWMVQSASEEIAVRGWLIPTLGIRYNPLIAVLLTGGVFGVIHLFNSGATVLSFINLTLSGFFFALYAINAGNIWGVCGWHMGWNFAQGNIYGLSVSGGQSIDNSLFSSKAIGTDFLTGGDFGPEGGFITTVFLVCGILFIGFIMYKKYKVKLLNIE